MQNVSWSVCFCFNVFCFWTYLNCQFFLNSSYRYLVYLNLLCFSFRSADATVRMFDRRSLTSGGVGSPVHKFEGHNAAVLCVQVIEKFWDYFLGFILDHACCYIFRNRTYLVIFNRNMHLFSVVSWQVIRLWKFCWGWHFEHLGSWEGMKL